MVSQFFGPGDGLDRLDCFGTAQSAFLLQRLLEITTPLDIVDQEFEQVDVNDLQVRCLLGQLVDQ